MKCKLLFVFLFLGVSLIANAQTEEPTSKRAARGFLNYSNYRQALEEYLKLLKTDSLNIEYSHSVGLCYLETNIDKSKAIPYLEWVVKQPRSNPSAWYDLGRAYAVNYMFDEAIIAFNQYKKAVVKDENYISASRWIEMCQNATELMKFPVNVTFTNLGPDINSDAPDMNPFITADETFLVFTTKRSGNIGGWLDYDGFFTSDIMYSQSKRGVWQKPRRLPNTINTAVVEESVGMSPDGSHLFIYMENFTASGDVYLSLKTGRSFNRVEPLGRNINTKDLETSACIAPNKKILFFTAALPGSFGGTDIYYSLKLPNGEWGVPVNAGNVINTKYDEEFPYLAPDGKTFYFSSNGHNSMGGFDVFKTSWNRENMSFSQPVNLGYPLNTPENNFSYSVSKSGRYAYLSAYRPDSYGDLDIYRVTLNDVPPPLHFISGLIMNPDSSHIFYDYNKFLDEKTKLRYSLDTVKMQPTVQDSARVDSLFPGIFEQLSLLDSLTMIKPMVTLYVRDFNTNESIGVYRPNVFTGRYVMILPPGKYKVSFTGSGFKTIVQDIELPDYETYREEQILNIVLHKE
jgi:hypothetical protein